MQLHTYSDCIHISSFSDKNTQEQLAVYLPYIYAYQMHFHIIGFCKSVNSHYNHIVRAGPGMLITNICLH